jgi:hypothetical protein
MEQRRIMARKIAMTTTKRRIFKNGTSIREYRAIEPLRRDPEVTEIS